MILKCSHRASVGSYNGSCVSELLPSPILIPLHCELYSGIIYNQVYSCHLLSEKQLCSEKILKQMYHLETVDVLYNLKII